MKAEPLYLDFGKLVRAYRRRLQLTQNQLGDRVGLSRTSITNIEQGRQKILLHQLFQFAECLEVSPEALLPELQNAPAPPEIERRLPRNLTDPEKEWVRRVVSQRSEEGGVSDATTQDRNAGTKVVGGAGSRKSSGTS